MIYFFIDSTTILSDYPNKILFLFSQTKFQVETVSAPDKSDKINHIINKKKIED